MKEERDPSSVQQVLNYDFDEYVCIRYEWGNVGYSEWVGWD